MQDKNLISLDKSIRVSRDILNGERACSDNIFMSGSVFGVGEFKFIDSPKGASISAEHVGLAQLVYEYAIKSFYTTVAKPDGSTERIFEPLPKGSHISDFLKDCNPDIFAWYSASDGSPLKFSLNDRCEVERADLTDYTKDCSHGCVGCERFEAVNQALNCATNEYIANLAEQPRHYNLPFIRLEEDAYSASNTNHLVNQAINTFSATQACPQG